MPMDVALLETCSNPTQYNDIVCQEVEVKSNSVVHAK